MLLVVLFIAAAPEYLIRTETTTSSGRTPSKVSTFGSVFAGRPDGSRAARGTDGPSDRPCTTTTLFDVRAGREVWASDCIAMKSEFPFKEIPYHAAGLPRPTCASSLMPLKSVETMNGLTVERFETDDAAVRATLYLAPGLGCMKIRAAHHWKGPSGEIVSTTITEPVEVRLGSHDPRLFEIPSNFREVLPSERKDAMWKYLTGQEPVASESSRRAHEREDKRYAKANGR